MCAVVSLIPWLLTAVPAGAAEESPARPGRAYSRPDARRELAAKGRAEATGGGSAAERSAPLLPRAEIFPEGEESALHLQRLQQDPGLILFDGARFDPLRHGEPDLAAFIPQPGPPPARSAADLRLAVIQFFDPPGPAERAALAAAGVEPLFYVPNRAYLVRGDALSLGRAEKLEQVRWTGPYRPGYKVDRLLGRLAAGKAPGGLLPGQTPASITLDLLMAPGVSLERARNLVGQALPSASNLRGAESEGICLLTLELPLEHLALDLGALARLEELVAIEPSGTVHLHNDDAVWIGQSYDIFARQNYSQSATVWKHGLLGAGEILAIADTGVDPDVCWMEDAAGLPAPSSVPAFGADRGPIPVDETRRKIIAYNLLGSLQDSATAYDVRSGDPHGTWVAVSAAGDNPDHPADESDPLGPHHDASDGMAPMAKLVVEDLGNDTGDLVGLGLPVPRVLDRLFDQEYTAGARISTNSWGSEGNQYDLLAFFTDRAVWNHPDLLVVFSAGNRGPYPRSLDSPGTAKNTITVGASEARLSPGEDLDPDNVAEFSSRGPTADGRIKPDLVMSGKQVITGDSDLGETGRSCLTKEVNGTSFAAPLTAGLASLAREYFRKGFYPTGSSRVEDGFIPSAALLKAAIIAGARSMSGRGGPDYSPCNIDTCDNQVGLCRNSFTICLEDADCSLCDGNPNLLCSDDRDCDLSLLQDDAPTTEQGWGRLLLDDGLYFAGDSTGLALWDIPRDAGITTGETWSSEFYAGGNGEDLEVVLTWTDPPSLVASPTNLVNDLDLRLTAPDGTVYWGNAWAARDRSPFTVEYTLPDDKPLAQADNVEMVRLAGYSLSLGVWKVEVIGSSVPGSPWADQSARQDFAVVAIGPVSTTGGIVRFDRQRYPCSGNVTVEVLDSNRSAPVTVTVTTGSGDQETLTLTDAGGGRFTATLPLAHDTPLATEDGALQVADSESLTATYDDDDPLLTSTAGATVECAGTVLVAGAAIGGGCDGDGFLDGGESVNLSLTLTNPGRTDLPGVEVTLRSGSADLFIEQDGSSFGTIAAGESATGATPFQLSLRDGATARDLRSLELLVTTSDSAVVRYLPLVLTVEADEVRTQGTWSEDFATSGLVCHDGSADPPVDSWYYFDLDQDCATSEDNWQVSFCFGDRMALLPSCTGTWLSTANENHHRLVSPQISTGSEGTTTILERVRFLEDYHFKLNEDGKLCDRTVVELFTNRDGRLLHTGYYRNQSADGDDEAVDLDLTEIAEFDLPPIPDGTLFQLIFHVASNDTETGSPNCSGSSGDEYRWRVDNVEVDYENIEITGDQSAPCAPGCSAPPVPAAVSAVNMEGGEVLVGWDPAAGADHYDVYRKLAEQVEWIGRVTAPDVSLIDRPPSSALWTYEVEAADASGLCVSAKGSSPSLGQTPPCRERPTAPAGLASVDAAAATCRIDLSWDPVAAPCGSSVSYRIYRSTAQTPAAEPGLLLAETSTTGFTDDALVTGWDDEGEPSGETYTYLVTAVDDDTGLESEGALIRSRAGGPRNLGTWTDDGGDAHLPKMFSELVLDENDAGAGWSRSPVALHHAGDWSYWTDEDSFGDGRYPALSCFSLVSPPVELDAASSPELHLWVNYDIEYLWDGLVIEIAGDDGVSAPIDPVGGYPGSFAETTAPPCAGAGGGTGNWINGCDYPPSQGAITGPDVDGLSGWQEFVFDLSAYAGQTVVFRANMSTDCGTDGGADLDDLTITGARLPTACAAGSCHPAPTFPGILSAADLDSAQTSGIELTWGDVESWGGGGPGEFVVYRDGAEVVRVGASERSWVDTLAEANVEHVYRVIARSGGGCDRPSRSPAQARAMDCGSLSQQTQDQALLGVHRTASAESLALRSSIVPGAALYRFLYSHEPQTVSGSPTFLESGAPEVRHEVAGDGLQYFYLVEGEPSGACP